MGGEDRTEIPPHCNLDDREMDVGMSFFSLSPLSPFNSTFINLKTHTQFLQLKQKHKLTLFLGGMKSFENLNHMMKKSETSSKNSDFLLLMKN